MSGPSKVKRHVVIDVEAIRDDAIPVKLGADAGEPPRFEPPAVWKIVTIGCFAFEGFAPESFGTLRGATEREKIDGYVGYLEKDHPTVVTWNGRFFDNPVIGHRAFHYGIPMPWWYGSARGPRYRYSDAAIDLKDVLSDHGAAMTADMVQTARLIGWPGAGVHSGADVAALHAAGDQASIDRHCLEDVANQAAIWLRWELLRGNVRPREWPRVANALLVFLEKQAAAKQIVEQVDRALFIGAAYSGQLTL